jgi:hypothetical protein
VTAPSLIAGLTPVLAKIERTTLGFEDHGVLTAYLHVKYDAALHQGVGGYDIRTTGGEYIARTLQACGVDLWEELVGRIIHVLQDETRWPRGIAPLPTEPGKPFVFAEVQR